MLADQGINKTYGTSYLTWLQKSSRRSIIVNNKRFFLSFPNTLFFMRIHTKYRGRNYLLDNLQVFFTDAEKLTLDSPIYCVPLPNLHTDGSACLFDEEEDIFWDDTELKIYARSKQTLAEKVVTHFWSTSFNEEEFESPWQREYRKTKRLLGNFQRWQAKTLKETTWTPDKKSMIDSDYTYKDLIDFNC